MRWRTGDLLTVRGGEWRVVRSTSFTGCEMLDLAGERAAIRRTLLLPFDRPRRSVPPRPRVVSRRRWNHHVRSVAASAPYGGLQFCPPAIRLLPYQLEPALAMLRHGALRLLLGDDVGLGKTVEAGLVIRELAKGCRLSRILIVLPASLRDQWTHELVSSFELQPIEADAAWLRRRVRELPRDVNPWSLPGVYIASTDFIKRPEALHPLEDTRWDLVVLDEAHAATPESDRRAAVHAVACRSRRVLLLSATPHTGDDGHFEGLCRIGGFADEPPIVLFSRSRADVSLSTQGVRSVVLPVNLSAAERRMHRLLEEYTGRLWKESAARHDRHAELLATLLKKRALSSARALALSLARRTELAEGVPPAPAQLLLPLDDETMTEDDEQVSVLAAPGLESVEDEQRMLGSVADAAAAAARDESKVRVLLRLLRRVKEPAIVFSEYRDTADRLRDLLAGKGRRVLALHGGLTAAERRAVLDEFSEGGALLVATDAASEGLNLHTACRLVIHFELPWTPARLHQRCGRVNRIGQTRRVHEVVLVANDTSEQLVLVPLMRRASRSSRYSNASVARQLSETRVAAHVLGGQPLSPPPPPERPAFLRTMDLSGEAREEAKRLELVRRLKAGWTAPRPARSSRSDMAITRARKAHQQPSATLIFRLAIGSSVDGPIHHEPVATVVRLAAPLFGHQDAASLRQQVALALTTLLPWIQSVLAPLLAQRLECIPRLYRAGTFAMKRREDAMTAELRSTARELVQAGLFDRRAMRLMRARTRVADMLEADRRAAPGPEAMVPMEADLELCAVFCGYLE